MQWNFSLQNLQQSLQSFHSDHFADNKPKSYGGLLKIVILLLHVVIYFYFTFDYDDDVDDDVVLMDMPLNKNQI